MCHEPAIAIHELNVNSDLTAAQIGLAVGRSEAYVLGWLGGHYRDNSAWDAMGDLPSKSERDDFLCGWSDGEAAWYGENA